MRFSLTDDQLALSGAVRDVLATAPDEALWDELASMGLFAALVPEPAGGLGLSDVDIVPILMEVGYAAPAHPVAETLLGAPCLVGDPRLEAVTGGAVRITLAGPDGLVPYGGDLVLVLDDTVRVVAPASCYPQPTVDPFRPLFRPDVPAGGVVGTDVAALRARVTLATAAQLVGLGRRMLDLTTTYVRARHQFGVPVGSFQAVKHHCADALLGLEFAEPAVLAAGWALSGRTDQAPCAVSLAAVLATEAANHAARVAIQCHGAIGYTVEYALHRFAKRVWALAATIDIDEHLDRVAEELELP